MRPFIFYNAPHGRRGAGDRRSVIPEIAGNFDDLVRTAEWVPFGTPPLETDRSVTGDEPRIGELGWLVTRAVSLRAF